MDLDLNAKEKPLDTHKINQNTEVKLKIEIKADRSGTQSLVKNSLEFAMFLLNLRYISWT